MKVTSFLSVCTLALATAVAANHGQYEHNSVAPAYTEAPTLKPAHHWAARDVREHEHSVHGDESDKKSAHHWHARETHSREAGRYKYTHEAPTARPTHHWETRERHEHEAAPPGGMKPSVTRHHARDAAKPTARPSHFDFKDEKDDESKPTRHWLRSFFKSSKKPEGSKPEHGRHYARDADHKYKHTDRPGHHVARNAEHKEGHKYADKPENHHFARGTDRMEEEEHKHSDKPGNRHHARDADRKEEHKHADKLNHHFARDADRKEEHKHADKPSHHYPRDADHKKEHKYTDKPENHHYARDADHKEEHKHADKPNHHFARDSDRKEEHEEEHEHTGKPENHHHARDVDHKEKGKHPEGKPFGHHVARDAEHKPKKTDPMHTGGAVAGKPGHHFVRSAQRPHFSGRPAGAQATGNPFAGTRMTPGSAISNVRGILTGGTGIKHTCDRCIAAMQVGQSLAQQGSASDFSNAVVGLCQQVRYKSNDACASAFAPGKVGPYISTLANADLDSQGKGFCKSYFGTC
jgi:hypothetical protein